ncbi:MAG TPA: hypothetical protein GXX18_18675 [Bacillales bacterium]|nr:hypothetical protein [Bacillales bacterium]
MKHIFLLSVFLFFLAGCLNSESTLSIVNPENINTNETQDEWQETQDYTIVAELAAENINIYAKKSGELFRDFKIDYKGSTYPKPYWMNITNPTWAPYIIYKDIDTNGKEELVIILTVGAGTGVLEQEAHVFRIENNTLVEVLVDNPIAVVLKNTITKLSPSEAEISIGDRKYKIDVKQLGIQPETLFDDLYFGNNIKFDVNDNNQLIAKVGVQISPTTVIGEIVIVYEFQDKMYQAKSIDFQSYD